MTLVDIVFYFFAVVTVVSACIVVFSRNIIYAAFSLLFTFFGVAGLYVLLNADFLAVTQLLIYVGGILVLLLFGVMLTNNVINVEMKTGTLQTGPAAIVVAVMTALLCAVFWITDWKLIQQESGVATTAPTLGEMFMTSYVLPFEVASVVLLVALLGAALYARRERRGS
jgi:NADH-quinone oxidoreductase subunit J